MMDSAVIPKNGFKNRAFFIISRIFMCLVLLLVLDEAHAAIGDDALSNPGTGAQQSAEGDQVTSKVICNVVRFVRSIGLPIMTGVIVGSSIMAIFGRMAWPAIAALIVFTAVFFGAEKIMTKFAAGVSGAQAHNCETV